MLVKESGKFSVGWGCVFKILAPTFAVASPAVATASAGRIHEAVDLQQRQALDPSSLLVVPPVGGRDA